MNTNLRGTGVALVTPFTADYQVDTQALQRLVSFVSPHVEYLVVLGTTGETATLTKAEKDQVLETVQAANTRRLPIVLGIGGNNTAEVVHTLRSTSLRGIEAVLSVSPYYNKPSQEGIYQHYLALAEASDVPIILYNVPGRTGSNLTAETTLRLAQHPNIIGIKEASGNMEQCMAIASGKPADFLLISGDDVLTLPLISLGAVGAISVLANALPDTFGTMVHQGLAGNYAASAQALFQLLGLNPLMYEEGNPAGIKAALAAQGIGTDRVRLPLTEASEELQAKIRAELQKLGRV